MNTNWLSEAEEFRAKHGLACTVAEISEVLSLCELGLLTNICPVCFAGEHFHCYEQGCECKVCAAAKAWAQEGLNENLNG